MSYQKYVPFLWMLLLLTLGACNNNNVATEFDTKQATWIKQTNFKVDFTDPHSGIKNIKNTKELMTSILEKVKAGETKAYDYETYKALSVKEVQQVFYPTDTIVTIDYETGYESGEQAVQNDLNIPAVTKFRIKQDWYFDETNFKMHTKITGVAPLETIFNEDNSVRGDRPLFWVFFEGVPKK